MIIKYTITLEESITDEKEMPRKRRHSIMSKATSYLPGINQAKTAGDPGGGPVYNLSKGPRKSLRKGGKRKGVHSGVPKGCKKPISPRFLNKLRLQSKRPKRRQKLFFFFFFLLRNLAKEKESF